jgi:hypothetical protein
MVHVSTDCLVLVGAKSVLQVEGDVLWSLTKTTSHLANEFVFVV